jgi:hypothetical protein
MGLGKIWSTWKIKKLKFKRTKLDNIEKRIKNIINCCRFKAFCIYFKLISRFIYIWVGIAWLAGLR